MWHWQRKFATYSKPIFERWDGTLHSTCIKIETYGQRRNRLLEAMGLNDMVRSFFMGCWQVYQLPQTYFLGLRHAVLHEFLICQEVTQLMWLYAIFWAYWKLCSLLKSFSWVQGKFCKRTKSFPLQIRIVKSMHTWSQRNLEWLYTLVKLCAHDKCHELLYGSWRCNKWLCRLFKCPAQDPVNAANSFQTL